MTGGSTEAVQVPIYESAIAAIYRLASRWFHDWSEGSALTLNEKEHAYECWRTLRETGAKLSVRRALNLSTIERAMLLASLPSCPGNVDFDFLFSLKFDQVG
jgi:hypothetical protein